MIPRVGVELEYMIVDRETLDVRPIADELLRAQAGEPAGEVEAGDFCWSNELVLHVIELKTNGPVETLAGAAEGFHQQVRRINDILSRWNARLLPTAMHPWMDPHRDTRLWPHDSGEIYAAFDRIFGCRGHGWSNLQSMHLNCPFGSDEQFGRLHAAVRLVLPIIPALAASSPIVDGRANARLDNRVDVYRTNCARIPSITGQVIPEPVFTPAEYHDRILAPIYADLRAHDPEGVLMHEWVNARGAIARFERNTIEIRLIDMQECPAADVAIAALVWATLEALMEERWSPLEQQRLPGTEALESILSGTLAQRPNDTFLIQDDDYLACFGRRNLPSTPGDIWCAVAREVSPVVLAKLGHAAHEPLLPALGRPDDTPLARRILRNMNTHQHGRLDALRACYHQLAESLARNSPFEVGHGPGDR